MSRITAVLLLLTACPSAEPEPPPPTPELTWPTLVCDDIAPAHCGFPFPSNVFTEPDPTTTTGLRLAFDAATLPDAGTLFDPTAWNYGDGFSPNGPLIVHLPGVTEDGLSPSTDIAASLEPDANTILIDTDTGDVVPHWAELDRSTDDEASRALLIQPAIRLRDATRYVVGVRRLSTPFGSLINPSPALASYRDGDGDPARQVAMTDVFTRIEDAGWTSDEVQAAWDFTTASPGTWTDWLLYMRDTSLDLVGPDGPTFTIDTVEQD